MKNYPPYPNTAVLIGKKPSDWTIGDRIRHVKLMMEYWKKIPKDYPGVNYFGYYEAKLRSLKRIEDD